MKSFVIAALLVVLATGVMAQSVPTTIYELRTGTVPENTQIDILGGTVVVTAVRYNGFACTDLAAGPYTAIWVYTSVDPAVVAGDVIEIVNGEYKEYYGLSEIDMTTFAGTWAVMGTAPTPQFNFTLAALAADFEPWESHVLTITDGFNISEILTYGQWNAVSQESALVLMNDDYFFDASVLNVGDCYNDVTGMMTYSYGDYKMNPLVDGLVVVDCAVTNDAMSFGSLKASYR